MKNDSSMSLDQALAAKDCKKKMEYMELGFVEFNEAWNFKTRLLKFQGMVLGDKDAPEKVADFLGNNIKKEWFWLEMQYKLLKKEETAYQKRLASFFIGKQRIASNITWYTEIPEISFGKRKVEKVYGSVHAIIRNENNYTAVILQSGILKYSSRARITENRPEYAPELIGAYLGLRKKYGRNLQIQLISEKSKDDSVDKPFDKRMIIDMDFSKYDIALLRDRLREILLMEGKADCTICKYRTLCKGLDLKSVSQNDDSTVRKKPEPIFTSSQQDVINFQDGAAAVYAVPGAGKTTTLVYRMRRLLEQGINPKNVLFVTFTNKAADEIKERTKKILQVDIEDELPDIYTYNGLGWQIIRDHQDITGELRLLTPLDEKRLILRCIEEYPEELKGYSYQYIEGKYGLINLLKASFSNLDKNEEAEKEKLQNKGHDYQQIKDLKKRYEELKQQERYIDFDEQITLARDILIKYPEILHKYGEQWEYIMADEFQDSSQENVDLLYLISKAGRGNLVVVGDADQSIFEWRKGSPKHLIEFKKNFQNAKQIYMSDNFRSSRQILDASNILISRNMNRIDMKMIAHKDEKTNPYRIQNCRIEQIPYILEILRNHRFRYGDIAILSRNNSALKKVKQVLKKVGIDSLSPSDLLINDDFFILAKDILDMFFAGFDKTDISFYRYMLAQGCVLPEKLDIKKTFYQNLLEQCSLVPIDIKNMDALLEYAVEQNLDTDMANAAKKLFRIFLKLGTLSAKESVKCIAETVGVDTDSPSVKAFLDIIDHQLLKKADDLWNYLNWMVNFADEEKIEYDQNEDKVNLMTAHSSKGKEFSAVIVVQSEDFEEKEEERRLLYVAMTRAKKVLFMLESPACKCEMLKDISHCMQTFSFG